MFPTSGLFQDIPCPFYADGVCNRPYCHFSHSKELNSAKSDESNADVTSCNLIMTPVYKPTPIRLLDKLDPVATEEFVDEYRPMNIPVYQPTPINQLEKSSSNSTVVHNSNGMYTTDSFIRPNDPPTYSPVVKPLSCKLVPPSIPEQPSPFVYYPSPAYPSVVDESPIEANAASIDTPLSAPLDSCSPPICENITDPVKSSSEKKLKRKTKSPIASESSSTSVNEEQVPVNQSPNLIPNSDESSDIKRQKLLSLYIDLYGDYPPTEPTPQNASPIRCKGKPALAPYLGKIDESQENIAKTTVVDSADKKLSNVVLIPRPRVPLRKSDKIPMPIRTRYLDQFIEECLVIYECPNDAYDRALNAEQACHDKAASRMAYLNAVIQQLKSLKAEKAKIQEAGAKKPVSSQYRVQSNSNPDDRTSTSAVKDDAALAEERLNEAVRGRLLYDQLCKYLLTDEQLVANGFPLQDKSDTTVLCKAKLAVPDGKKAIYATCQDNERICCRCGARFKVDDFGNALVQQKCVYHWGKPVKRRIPGSGVDLRYVCCQSEVGQPGCQLCAAGHVHDSNKWTDTEGFVTTLPPLVPSENESSDSVNVFALDCEMVYTTAGCELGRVTIVDSKLNTVLDSIVHPFGMLVDCNTRFSGLSSDQLEQSEIRITDIQAKLLHLFDSDTILVGHSLESDLLALKLIHGKIVDTSVMFPHRYGPPKKRALRNLVSELLNRVIQEDDGGHSSIEDAVACMELVQQKVKEDLRRGRWVIK